ncbi:unnamed protein product, partial [marine sediment metagenome]
MEILLVHLGTPCECFIASSLIKGLKNRYAAEHPLHIHALVKNTESNSIFKYNYNVRLTYPINKVPNEFKRREFDLLINLHPDFDEESFFQVNAKKKLGFHYTDGGYKTYKYMYDGVKTNKNLFQMYYILSELKWKGEGYNFKYHPKHKNRKNRTGLYIV